MKTVKLFESIINYTADAIAVLDVEDRIILMNAAFEKIYGWTTAELVGKKFPIIPDHLLEETKAIFDRVHAGETVSDYVTTRKRKDGTFLKVNLTLSPVRDEQGTIIGKASITRDVTEYYNILDELKRMNELYALITNNMSDIVSVADFNGNLLYFSPSHERFSGISELESDKKYQYIHPDDRLRVKRALEQLKEQFVPVTFEYRMLHVSGDFHWLEATAVPAEDEDGKKMIITSRDISRRKEAEEMLRNTEKMLVLGDLAAGIAHEIRNPLTTLRGFLQLIRETEAPQTEYVDLMFSEVDRINSIVIELLLLAKPQIANYTVIDLIRVLKDVLRLLKSEALMKQVVFESRWNVQNAFVFGEANHLKQVFINIIKNGIEAMSDGGVIAVRLEKSQCNMKCYNIHFEDQGCGIDEEEITKIGTPFYTSKEKGTGLGIMVSKKILKDHDGDMAITSELGIGTTVTVTLPYYTKEPLD